MFNIVANVGCVDTLAMTSHDAGRYGERGAHPHAQLRGACPPRPRATTFRRGANTLAHMPSRTPVVALVQPFTILNFACYINVTPSAGDRTPTASSYPLRLPDPSGLSAASTFSRAAIRAVPQITLSRVLQSLCTACNGEHRIRLRCEASRRIRKEQRAAHKEVYKARPKRLILLEHLPHLPLLSAAVLVLCDIQLLCRVREDLSTNGTGVRCIGICRLLREVDVHCALLFLIQSHVPVRLGRCPPIV